MNEIEKFGYADSNPENKLIEKEEDNPCLGCVAEHANDADVLDFCHYYCKATTKEVTDES